MQKDPNNNKNLLEDFSPIQTSKNSHSKNHLITYNSNWCSPAKEGKEVNSLIGDPVFHATTQSVLNTNMMNHTLSATGFSRNNSQAAASMNISVANMQRNSVATVASSCH